LIGFGRIGRTVERYLQSFGPRLLVADPNVKPADLPKGVEPCDLEALLKRADLVSLHAHRAREEGPLLAQRELFLMKKGSFLVNTARGFLVDEEALLAVLKNGHLAGCALDVFEEEPYRGPLTALPQVICTPHVATLTRSSRIAMELKAVQNVVDFFRQAPLHAPAQEDSSG
jgi:D-3-phosphoglycerate dehydrogenase